AVTPCRRRTPCTRPPKNSHARDATMKARSGRGLVWALTFDRLRGQTAVAGGLRRGLCKSGARTATTPCPRRRRKISRTRDNRLGRTSALPRPSGGPPGVSARQRAAGAILDAMTAEYEGDDRDLCMTLSGGMYADGEPFVGWRFSEPVTRLRLTPAEARDLAAKIIDGAERIEAACRAGLRPAVPT
ncbi:MAG: hypothetical protein ACRD19_15085, partial [Terriglobia bacterium]